MNGSGNRITGRLVVGLIMAGLGVLWTLDNLGLTDASRIVRWWPALLVMYGIMKLLGIGVARRVGAGAILSAVGAVLLLGPLFHVHVSWLPVFLIAAGVALIVRSTRSDYVQSWGSTTDSDNQVRLFAMMGAVTRRSRATAFRGGDLSAVMGGVQLDLTQAELDNGRAVLDVFAMWGGIDIRVPDDWRVELEVTPVMGSFEDNSHPGSEGPVTGTLVIRGFVMMGGGEVKNRPLREGEGPRVMVGVGRMRRRDRYRNRGWGEPDAPPPGDPGERPGGEPPVQPR